MWQSTSTEQKITKASTTLRASAPIFKGLATIFFTALLAFPPIARAYFDYVDIWINLPANAGSNSYANAGCALCHTTNGGSSEWNAYGWAIRQQGNGAFNKDTLAARVTAVQSTNSDGNSSGETNLEEITANTQPGWTAPGKNSTYDAFGLVTSTATAPTTITGFLDPPAYTVGGTVSGLTGSITLQINGGNSLVRTNNGGFIFGTALHTGSAYSVTVSSQPVGQTCTVTNGSGTIASANVTNVTVTCPLGCVDVDGNGVADALTDGVMLIRAMLGLTGISVTNGAVGANATRTTWAQIRAYLNASCATDFGP